MAIEYSYVPEGGVIGKGIERKNFYALSTGKGSISSEELERQVFRSAATIPGVEGSLGLWVTEPGRQKITFEIVTWEKDFSQDTFKVWDGEKLIDLADRAIATDKAPNKNRWSSGEITLEFNTLVDEWGILALDEGDRRGASQIRIKSVEWLGLAPQPNYPLGSLYETSGDALTAWQYQNTEQVGSFGESVSGSLVTDPADRFDVPIGSGEAVEGWISLSSGVPVELNIYDSADELVSSEIISGIGERVGFGFEGEGHRERNPAYYGLEGLDLQYRLGSGTNLRLVMKAPRDRSISVVPVQGLSWLFHAKKSSKWRR